MKVNDIGTQQTAYEEFTLPVFTPKQFSVFSFNTSSQAVPVK
jgi:hypothetical protein